MAKFTGPRKKQYGLKLVGPNRRIKKGGALLTSLQGAGPWRLCWAGLGGSKEGMEAHLPIPVG